MTPEQTAAPALPLHPQDEMECRRCGVHCDKVVYPGACLSRGCPFVYSYEAWGHTYVGCMQKVYEVEIDLDMLRAAEGRKPGFGAIRAVRRPLPMCRAEVERTYESRARRRARLRQPGVLGAAGRRADVPRDRAAQGELSSASSPPAAHGASRARRARPAAASGSAERKRVDRADPDPRNATPSPCSGPWRVLVRRGDLRRLQVQLDRREVRGADGRRLAAVAGAAICAVTASICAGRDAVCSARGASRSCCCSRSIVRSVALTPAWTSWTSTCSPVIVPSAESRWIASCTCVRGTFRTRSADAACPCSTRAPTWDSRRATM